jgi:excisionase family DNA binding protein
MTHVRHYTVKTCAERFGVGKQTVYKWIRDGDIGCLRLPGGDIRIRAEDVEAFEASRLDAPSSSDQTTATNSTSSGSESSSGRKIDFRDPILRARVMRGGRGPS